jgi:hypothetical protein
VTRTEELITAALAKQVTRAPDPAPVIAALREPKFRRRTRPALVIAVGTVLVATAIIGPVALFGTDQEAAPPSQSITQDLPADAVNLPPIPMRYTLSAAPPGYTETERRSGPDGLDQMRTWSERSSSSPLTISVHVVRRGAPAFDFTAKPLEDASSVAINGVQGRVRNDLLGKTVVGATVRWNPDDNTVLEVQTGESANPKQQAISAANAVRPNDTATLTPPVSFAALPDQLGDVQMRIGRSPSGKVSATVELRAKTGDFMVMVQVMPPGTVNGADDDRSWSVSVPQPDGRELRLIAVGPNRLSKDELTAMGRAAKVAPTVDTSWLAP